MEEKIYKYKETFEIKNPDCKSKIRIIDKEKKPESNKKKIDFSKDDVLVSVCYDGIESEPILATYAKEDLIKQTRFDSIDLKIKERGYTYISIILKSDNDLSDIVISTQ
jgi:hypothetical protein